MATELDAKVLPAKMVPPLDVLNKPTLLMLRVAVTKLFALANVAVNCNALLLLDVAAVTDARTFSANSPSSVVAVAPGAVPVPNAMWLMYLLPAIEPSDITKY